MYDVIYNDLYYSTGAGFKINGYDLIRKTGTAQYINSETKLYYYDNINYIRSFSGMFPKDNPEIIVYVLTKKTESARGIQDIVKGLVKDISNYKSIYNPNISTDATTYKMGNYLNKNIYDVKKELENKFKNVIIIGNGDKVVKQYPNKDVVLGVNEKVYLLTNGNEKTLPNMYYWSKREVNAYCTISNIKCNIEGSGFVYEQSLESGVILKPDDVISLKLKSKLEKEENVDEDNKE